LKWDFWRFYLKLLSLTAGTPKVKQLAATKMLQNLVPGHNKEFLSAKKAIGQRYHYLVSKWGLGAVLLFPMKCPDLPSHV